VTIRTRGQTTKEQQQLQVDRVDWRHCDRTTPCAKPNHRKLSKRHREKEGMSYSSLQIKQYLCKIL